MTEDEKEIIKLEALREAKRQRDMALIRLSEMHENAIEALSLVEHRCPDGGLRCRSCVALDELSKSIADTMAASVNDQRFPSVSATSQIR